ncbi:MAG TPA: CcmD family protein [Cyclobacteriaceae bacterium]|jgi:CcmD family protein
MKYVFALLLFLTALLARAQEKVEMADTMRSSGKIYIVVGIVVIILSGLFAYLFLLDRKISRLEKETGAKPIDRD